MTTDHNTRTFVKDTVRDVVAGIPADRGMPSREEAADKATSVLVAAMDVAGAETLGELMEYCTENATTPQALADATRCRNCGVIDSACLREGRQTGVVCCKQCREWPMHSQNGGAA